MLMESCNTVGVEPRLECCTTLPATQYGERGKNCEAVGLEAVWSTGESSHDTIKEREIMEEREGVPPCSWSTTRMKIIVEEIVLIRGVTLRHRWQKLNFFEGVVS